MDGGGALQLPRPRDACVYRFTVSDPETWDRLLDRRVRVAAQSTDKVYEYACHEGNYAMGNIMRGARILEKDAMDAKGSGR